MNHNVVVMMVGDGSLLISICFFFSLSATSPTLLLQADNWEAAVIFCDLKHPYK